MGFLLEDKDVSQVSRELLATQAAQRLISKFNNLHVGNKIINCPFWMNNDPDVEEKYRFYVPNGGKFTPEQQQARIDEALENTGFDPNNVSSLDIREFLKRNAVGIDCSGLAYQVVRAVYEGLGGIGFDTKVFGKKGVGITKTGADDLTSLRNSRRIYEVTGIKPGDMIRGLNGKHALVITEKLGNLLKGIHSSDGVPAEGVSSFVINIVDSSKDIFHQEWSEVSIRGIKYNERLLRPEVFGSDDGVWRLNIIDQIYRKDNPNS